VREAGELLESTRYWGADAVQVPFVLELMQGGREFL
jgi:hypothetical protein